MKKIMAILAGMAAFAAALFGDPAGYFVKLEAYDVEPGKALRAADEIEKDHAAFRAAGNIPQNLFSTTLAPGITSSLSNQEDFLQATGVSATTACSDETKIPAGPRAKIILNAGEKGEVLVSLDYLDSAPADGKDYVSGNQVMTMRNFGEIAVSFNRLPVTPGKARVAALRKLENSCRIYALSIFSLPEIVKSDPDGAAELRVEKLTVPAEAYAEFDGSKASFEKLRKAASESAPIAVMPMSTSEPEHSLFKDSTAIYYPVAPQTTLMGDFVMQSLGPVITARFSRQCRPASISAPADEKCGMLLELSYLESALASKKKIAAMGQVVERPGSFKNWKSNTVLPFEPGVPAVAASRLCEGGVEVLAVTLSPKEP